MHVCVPAHVDTKYFSKFFAHATEVLQARKAGLKELALLRKWAILLRKKYKEKKKRRKDSDLHAYRAIRGKCLYFIYQPPQALLTNSNLEIYDVIIITVVHPAYFSNLQCIIMGLHE